MTGIPTQNDELHAFSDLLKQLVENIHEVFWISSVDSRKVLYANPAYEKVWGRTRESLYNRPFDWLESIHVSDRPNVKSHFLNLANGSFDIEYRILRPDGEIRWIRDQGIMIYDDNHQPIRIVGLAYDITKYKLLKERCHFYAEQLEQKNSALKEILGLVHTQKVEMDEKIKNDLNSFVFPIINQMKIAKSFQSSLLIRLEESIRSLVMPIKSIEQNKEKNGQHLSRKEMEISKLINMGHSTKEMANLLNLSTHTITTYRNRIRKKLGITSKKITLSDHLKNKH